MEYISEKKDKKTLRDIILNHLSKILELSCDEFKGGYWIKQIKGNYTEEIYVPDSRKKIIQAIEFFSYILQPFYDEPISKEWKTIEEKINDNLKKFNDNEIKREVFIINKLGYMKRLFIALSHLLCRKEYLKMETMEDVIDEMEDDEENEIEEEKEDKK